MLSPARSAWCTKKLNSTGTLIQRTTTEAPQGHMYYIGLDVHKKTISYCVKDASGQVHQEGKVGATRWELVAGTAHGSTLKEAVIKVVAYSSAPTGLTSFALVLWGLRLAAVDRRSEL